MTPVSGTIVETGKLAQVVGYSLLAGVGIAVIFSLAVSSAAGLYDAMRTRRAAAAAAWGTLATLCAVAVVGVAILGVVVMTQK
jgi:hypothetical protein